MVGRTDRSIRAEIYISHPSTAIEGRASING